MKQIRLVNFGGYEDSTFDFTDDLSPDTNAWVPPSLRGHLDPVIPISLFFGPNGIGKSTILEAIRFAANPKVFYGRQQGPEVYLRPWVRDTEFIPLSDHVLAKKKAQMRVEALFTDGTKDYRVHINNKGFEEMELPERPEGAASGGHFFYVDADNPINWAKFQLVDTHAQRFIDLAEAIYGYECDLDGDVKDHHFDESSGELMETQTYYQDLIITKGDTKVHFKNMSAGEKKIATMIRMLCNPDATGDRDIILIDNWEMHVYFKRHPRMIEKLREYFSGKQIIATTHSQSMIEYGASVPYVKNFDLEEYKPEYRMLEETNTTVRGQVDFNGTVEDVPTVAVAEGVGAQEVTPVAEELPPPPEGMIRKLINGPFGEMYVLVPANNDKAQGDNLQNLVNNAVAIEVDEMGSVSYYHDPVEQKFKPGSGQIKRAPTQLSPGQRRRLERGEQIITDPVKTESTAHSLEDLAGQRTEAVKSIIASEVSRVSPASERDAAVDALTELGKTDGEQQVHIPKLCCGGFCGTPPPSLSQARPDVIPTLQPGEGEVTVRDVDGLTVKTLPQMRSEQVDAKTFAVQVAENDQKEEKKGFWATVLGAAKTWIENK